MLKKSTFIGLHYLLLEIEFEFLFYRGFWAFTGRRTTRK